jgi:hypothetical protein
VVHGEPYLFKLVGEEGEMNSIHLTIKRISKLYEETRKYRDFRIESGDMKGGKLELMKGEKVIRKEKEIMNVTNEVNLEGEMIITNIRVVWWKKEEEKVKKKEREKEEEKKKGRERERRRKEKGEEEVDDCLFDCF